MRNIRLKPILFASAVSGLAVLGPSRPSAATLSSINQPSYQEVVDRLRETGLAGEFAHELLKKICSVGPRLTGSAQAAAAVDVGLGLMRELGFDNVHAEPVEVGRWVRGRVEEAVVLPPAVPAPLVLSVSALGGSVAGPAGGVTAPVVEVGSLDELARMGRSVARKIVFFNRPMDRRAADAFAAYAGAADQRVDGASAAARQGAVAALVRSLTFRLDGNPHTGLMHYAPGVPRIPAAAVSTRDAETLSALLKKGRPIELRLRLDCRDEGRVLSANVVGELRGAERPREVVLLGGHLDSWDLGTGAHDDAAGCAAALEALRLLKSLGLTPRRTIRAVLFMDEEFGGTGGRTYVRAPQRRGERHIVAAESDSGAFLPIGLAVGGPDRRALERITPFESLFKPLGVLFMIPGGGGVDVGPLIQRGAAPAAVRVSAQTYFDFHHSALDVVSSVHPRELELQAVILAALAFIFAQEGLP